MSAAETQAPGAARGATGGGRRRSRELALQALYQWLLNPDDASELCLQAAEQKDHVRADQVYLEGLIRGVIEHHHALRQAFQPYLDRRVESLSPIEHGILLLGAFELAHRPEVPYRVVINEAIELAKRYGGTDGHKYVNGVLDRLAPRVRPGEVRTRS